MWLGNVLLNVSSQVSTSIYLFFARNLALPFKLYYAHKILESRNCGNAVNAFNTFMDLKDCQLNETHIIKH